MQNVMIKLEEKEKLYLQSYAMFVFQNWNVSTNGKSN